jgi:hypothetical protein
VKPSRGTTMRTAALALAAAAALSACGPSQLGAAAIVDDQRITVSEVQHTLKDVRELRERFALPTTLGAEAARMEVERRVLDLVFERAATDLGLQVTAGDVAQAQDAEDRSPEEIARLAAENNVSLASLDQLYRRFTLEQKISDQVSKLNPGATEAQLNAAFAERLVATAKKMQIKINPRYGEFDPTVGQIAAVRPDFLRAPKA